MQVRSIQSQCPLVHDTAFKLVSFAEDTKYLGNILQPENFPSPTSAYYVKFGTGSSDMPA